MMKVFSNLYVGSQSDCFYDNKNDWIVIHACKDPCHKYSVGYRGNLNKNHPNYLIKKMKNHLFLNMVDMNQPLSHEYTEPIIITSLNFIEENINQKNILIHCNLGFSRSPALTLLFLAKRTNEISDKSYNDAKNDFIKIYPNYRPRTGIEIYLKKYWDYVVTTR